MPTALTEDEVIASLRRTAPVWRCVEAWLRAAQQCQVEDKALVSLKSELRRVREDFALSLEAIPVQSEMESIAERARLDHIDRNSRRSLRLTIEATLDQVEARLMSLRARYGFLAVQKHLSFPATQWDEARREIEAELGRVEQSFQHADYRLLHEHYVGRVLSYSGAVGLAEGACEEALLREKHAQDWKLFVTLLSVFGPIVLGVFGFLLTYFLM